MKPIPQNKIIAELQDKTSNLNLGLRVLAITLNVRRVRKHYRKGNHKRVAWYAFGAGEQVGMLSRDLTRRIEASI